LNNYARCDFLGNFIDGRFIAPSGGAAFLSGDPGDLDNPVGEAVGDPSAVDAAVAAARGSFGPWRSLALKDRIAALRRYQKILKARRDDLALLIARETGKPLAEAGAEAQSMIDKVDLTIDHGLSLLAEKSFPMDKGVRGAWRYQPLGVAAVLGPFNIPGHLPNGQIVPALLLGNTVVFKPSELTPFTGQLLGQCFAAAKFPPGVINLVQGGGDVGGRLAAHPDVNAVLFTGSAATGERLERLCAGSGKMLALEMGGKNAALVLADAPLDLAVKETVHGAFSTTGQRCSSTSRVLLHKKIAPAFIEKFLEKTAGLKPGYFDESPAMGPLVRGAAVQNFLTAQEKARDLGFKALRQGGAAKTARRGYYVTPSVHLWEGPFQFAGDRAYWDEELFAPDVAIYVFSDEDEMVAANNASRYGLVASVFTRSEKKFQALRPLLQNGVVHWNRSTAMSPGLLPFGGIKASGNHRPAGLFVPFACAVPVASVEVAP